MKFLPIVEFEKRQKSTNRNQTRAIMNSMMTKVGFRVDAPVWALSIPHEKTKTQIRHLMWLGIRRKHWNWKKRGMMLSREKNMKLPRNYILKHFNWTLIRDRCGQIDQYAEMQWRNTKMLWLTVFPPFPSTQNVLRRAFKLLYPNWFPLRPISYWPIRYWSSIWKPDQVSNS